MGDFAGGMATWIWVGLAVVFGVVEAFTLGILTIWFAIGAVAAAIAAYFGLGIVWQFTIFLVVSVVLIYFTRPIAEKYLKIGKEKTNVDLLVGEKAVVVRDISPNNVGQARIRGAIWSAEAVDKQESFGQGEEVIVARIEGVRLIVRREE